VIEFDRIHHLADENFSNAAWMMGHCIVVAGALVFTCTLQCLAKESRKAPIPKLPTASMDTSWHKTLEKSHNINCQCVHQLLKLDFGLSLIIIVVDQ